MGRRCIDTPHGANPACLTTKHSYCPPRNVRLELETLSTVAKVFKVEHFLSEKEADHVVERASRSIKRSTTSGFVSNTRTLLIKPLHTLQTMAFSLCSG